MALGEGARGVPGPGRFFLPGPTEVRPEILEAQAQPMIAHRGAGFQALMGELQEGLRDVFRTEQPVVILDRCSNGTYTVELNGKRIDISKRELKYGHISIVCGTLSGYVLTVNGEG